MGILNVGFDRIKAPKLRPFIALISQLHVNSDVGTKIIHTPLANQMCSAKRKLSCIRYVQVVKFDDRMIYFMGITSFVFVLLRMS